MRGRRESEDGGSAIEDEVDRILEKISEQGMDALTDEERRILQEASRR
jgi:predicted DNA binding protein